jgi:hypothetical protein
MPIFACRWPNGDLTILAATNKDDAICRLDEIENAETSQLFSVNDLLLDLRLTAEGHLTTQRAYGFGEICGPEVMSKAYPILWEARGQLAALGNDQDPGKTIRKAVEQERERIGPAPESVPIDPTLRAIKAASGMPDALLRKLKRAPGGAKRKW